MQAIENSEITWVLETVFKKGLEYFLPHNLSREDLETLSLLHGEEVFMVLVSLFNDPEKISSFPEKGGEGIPISLECNIFQIMTYKLRLHLEIASRTGAIPALKQTTLNDVADPEDMSDLLHTKSDVRRIAVALGFLSPAAGEVRAPISGPTSRMVH